MGRALVVVAITNTMDDSQCADRNKESETSKGWDILQATRAFSILSWISALVVAILHLRGESAKKGFILLPFFSAYCAFAAIWMFNRIMLDLGAGYIFFILGATFILTGVVLKKTTFLSKIRSP